MTDDVLLPLGVAETLLDAVLDAPDLDSVLESNRESAHRLLEAADLWLFVTTAARYGDALPWRVLQDAVERQTTIAMVLNRVAPESLPEVRGDLLERLRSHGLQGAPLFVVQSAGSGSAVPVPSEGEQNANTASAPERDQGQVASRTEGLFVARDVHGGPQ